MKSTSISIISYHKLWERTLCLLKGADFSTHNIRIYAREPDDSYARLYEASSWRERWGVALELIADGLHTNIDIVQGRSPNECHDARVDGSPLPSWMKERVLTPGELSVIYKHFSAMRDFTQGHDDYCLICEDDVVFQKPRTLSDLTAFLASCNPEFDFIDFAGGDGLECPKESLISVNDFSVCNIPWRSSRTACCYAINQSFARAFVEECSNPFMPIDWMLSYIMCSRKYTVYWTCNSLVEHGSSIGIHKSWRYSN